MFNEGDELTPVVDAECQQLIDDMTAEVADANNSREERKRHEFWRSDRMSKARNKRKQKARRLKGK